MTLAQQDQIIMAGLIITAGLALVAGFWFVCAFYVWVGRKIRELNGY